MSEAVVKVERVSKSYPAPAGRGQTSILRGASLTVRSGESVAIVGPSGSGKSTLLHIIGALDQPTSGSVFFEGRNLAEMNERSLAMLRNHSIGFVFQAHHLLPQLTVLENVLVPLLAYSSAARPDAIKRGKKLLERVGLGEQIHQRASLLSGGERQRVAIVRALINEPLLLLADEPTGSLDQASSAVIADLICSVNAEQKVSMVVVTHSADLARRMGRSFRLHEGILEDLQ